MKVRFESATAHPSAASFFREQLQTLAKLNDPDAYIEFSHRERRNVEGAAYSLADGTKIKTRTVDYPTHSAVRFFIAKKGSGKGMPAMMRRNK